MTHHSGPWAHPARSHDTPARRVMRVLKHTYQWRLVALLVTFAAVQVCQWVAL